MIPQKTIGELIDKHSKLEKDLSSGKLDNKLFAEKSKEYSDLNEIIEDAKKYISFNIDKSELEKILEDRNSDDDIKISAEFMKSSSVHLFNQHSMFVRFMALT